MVERILRYLKGNPGKGVWMEKSNDTSIIGYCDADWAGNKKDRKSTTGFCTFVGGNLVTWRSKKQKVVSLSSAEAEYRAMRDVTKELVWIKYLLHDLGVQGKEPISLYCDNQAALHIASNPVFHERTKHIEIDCHFVREKIQDGTISPRFVRSEDQVADIFTKATTSLIGNYIQSKIGLLDLHQPVLRGSVDPSDERAHKVSCVELEHSVASARAQTECNLGYGNGALGLSSSVCKPSRPMTRGPEPALGHQTEWYKPSGLMTRVNVSGKDPRSALKVRTRHSYRVQPPRIGEVSQEED